MRRATTGDHGRKNPAHDPRKNHVNVFDPPSQTWACITCNVWHYPDCGCDECAARQYRPADRDFEAPHAYQHTHARPTEKAAAKAAEPLSGAGRRKVYDHLAALGGQGATDHELVAALGMNPSTVRPRRLELVEAGAVVDSGRTRQTESGRAATVWIVSEVAASLDSPKPRGEVRAPAQVGGQEGPPPKTERLF